MEGLALGKEAKSSRQFLRRCLLHGNDFDKKYMKECSCGKSPRKWKGS